MFQTRIMIRLGYVIPFMFLITLVVCGTLQTGYSHQINLVSELGYLGSRTQYFFTAGLLTCSLLSIFFIVGLLSVCKTHKLSTLPVLILFSYTVSIAGAALFPLPIRWHGILGSPSFLLLLSPVFAGLMWHNHPEMLRLKLWIWITMVFFMLGFLTFFPDVLGEYMGLKQRFFHLGWVVWFLYLSWAFQRLVKPS